MDDGTPSLEVGFAIDTGGSLEMLQQLAAAMDSTEAKILREAQNIERATGGMLNLSGASASITAFGNATTRDAQTAARELGRVEKAGESLSRQLDRQASTFGKTREEIRGMKVETAALAAEQAGLTELAARLREQEAALSDAEFAAMRRNRAEADAAAEAKTQAAQQAAVAAAVEAKAVKDAADAYRLFETVAKQRMAAFAEQQSAAEKEAAFLARLRAELDPLSAAQARYDAELERYADLAARGKLTEQEHGQAIQQSTERLNESKRMLEGHTASLGLNRMQFVIGASAVHRFADSIMAGTPPMRAFMMQAGDLATVLQMDDGGVAGGLAKVRSLINPTSVGIAAIGAVVVAGTLAWLDYSAAMEKVEALSQGSGAVIGLSTDKFQANAQAAADAGNISVKAAGEIQTAYVKMGGIGSSVLSGLTAITTDFAKATGQDLAGAEQELGRAFQDPAKGADELTQRYGALSAAQLDHIHNLVEQNDKYGAQAALLQALGPQFENAAEHANALERAGHSIAVAWQDAWTWIGKTLDRAAGGSTIAEQIAHLEQRKTIGDGLGDVLANMFNDGSTSSIDKQIAALQQKLRAESTKAARSQAVGALKVVDDTVGENTVGALRQQLGAVNKLLADGGKAAGLNADQYTRARQAQEMLTHAVTTYLPEAEKQVKIAQVDAQIAVAKKAHDQARVASLTQQKSEIENSGKLMTAAQAEAQAIANGTKAKTEATKAGDQHAATLAREAAAQQAQIRNTYLLADAYGQSGAAALIAEARVRAESKAIKDRGDIEAATAREVRLAISQRVADAAKSTASLNDQATIQAQVNALVEAGTVRAERAAEVMRDRMADLPMLAAMEAAAKVGDVKGAKEAADALDQQRGAQVRLNDAQRDAALDSALQAGRDQIAQLQEELRLVDATDAARVHALATLKATQEAEAKNFTGVKGAEYIRDQVKIADLQQANTAAVREHNDALGHTADIWELIARNVDTAAQGMGDAFGQAGSALGGLMSIYANYRAQEERASVSHNANMKAATTENAKQREMAKYQLQTSTAQIGMYGDLAGAAKTFFAEGSSGYQALQKAEQVFRAIQFALSLRAMAQDAAETATSIANSVARTAKNAVEAVTKAISSLPFPLNIVAGAATIAALAAIGVSIAGGFGGGSKPAPSNTGTGTVLGDSAAKSDSIKNALDALKNVDTTTSIYAREMSASLKSIDSQIGSFAALVARTDNINASTGVNTGFQTNALGSILSAQSSLLSHIPIIGGIFGAISNFIGSLFGSKNTITGTGLYGAPQSLGQIMTGGFNAQNYSDIDTTHKFFGITTGHSYSTNYAPADAQLQSQFTLILKSFDQAIAAAAGPLGEATDAVQSRLNGFIVNLGKIDLSGLSGDDIKAKLENIFGAAADDMASAAFPDIARFQKVGEGAFETLVRVASTVEAVTSALTELGGATATLGIDAKMGLAGQFDSISDLTSAADAYFQAFYSQEEQTAAKTAQMTKVFESLGLTMPGTLDAFRALVDAQDLTSAAGQSTYATLLKLAPAFADLQTAMSGAKSAADILSERQDLQRQLLELQGDTAAVRALDLAKVDVSNRVLQQQVWAIQDAQDAAKAADDLRQAWQSVGDSIADEVKRIRGLSNTGSSTNFATLQGQFNAANMAARGGDQDAAKSLPGLSQALLTAAAQVATSKQELDRVQAQTAAQLDATRAAIAAITAAAAAGATTSSVAATAAAGATAAASTPTAANDDLLTELQAMRTELAQMHADNNAGHAANASASGRSAKVLENVSNASGGDAITTVAA